MRLAHISWVKAQAQFEASDMALLAVGSTENHGRHLALGTDTLVPDRLLELIEARKDVLIAPTLPYGACDDFMSYPGTITLGTDLLGEVLRKITGALYGHGIRRFAILNGHGGNIAAIDRVGLELYGRGAWLCALNWWLMAGQINPGWKGGHGGGEETAAVMAVNPAFVDSSLIGDQDLVNDVGESMPTAGYDNVSYKGVHVRFPRDTRSYSGNGWIGPDHPKHATAAWGREMLEATADYIADFLGEFERIPLPQADR